MLSKKVSLEGAQFASPTDTAWSSSINQHIELVGVPVSMQPSIYIASTMQERKIGKVGRVNVASMHNGRDIAFRLQWADPDQNLQRSDNHIFPDGAALMFPMGDDAPLVTMGAEGQPVNAWHWRADRPEEAFSNISTGLGTTEVTDKKAIQVVASYEGGIWSMVFRRAIATEAVKNMRQFTEGSATKVAVAVWEGGNGERGGLKAFSPSWVDIELGL